MIEVEVQHGLGPVDENLAFFLCYAKAEGGGEAGQDRKAVGKAPDRRVDEDRAAVETADCVSRELAEEGPIECRVVNFELGEELVMMGGRGGVTGPKRESAKAGKVDRREGGGRLVRDDRYECCELDEIWQGLAE